jgi:hypothetical protein
MKIFIIGDKVNFVDDNNVMLGYDTEQFCCEQADWFIADSPKKEIIERAEGDIPELSGYSFDPSFFMEIRPSECERLDNGTMVIFKIINKDGLAKFIHLYNCHNGYYGHGFTFDFGKNNVREGCL